MPLIMCYLVPGHITALIHQILSRFPKKPRSYRIKLRIFTPFFLIIKHNDRECQYEIRNIFMTCMKAIRHENSTWSKEMRICTCMYTDIFDKKKYGYVHKFIYFDSYHCIGIYKFQLAWSKKWKKGIKLTLLRGWHHDIC